MTNESNKQANEKNKKSNIISNKIRIVIEIVAISKLVLALMVGHSDYYIYITSLQ